MEGSLFGRLKALFFALPSRCARPASVGYNLFKTTLQSLVMWSVFLVLGPFVLVRLENLLRAAGWHWPRFSFPLTLAIVLFWLGAAVAWWSAWSLVRYGEGTPLPVDSTNKLVVRGPYRWIRNPMAASSLAQGAAVGLAVGSPLVLLYVVGAGFVWHFSVRFWEEHDMEARFGNEFVRYRRAVRCWLPRFHPYALEGISEVKNQTKGNNIADAQSREL